MTTRATIIQRKESTINMTEEKVLEEAHKVSAAHYAFEKFLEENKEILKGPQNTAYRNLLPQKNSLHAKRSRAEQSLCDAARQLTE